MLRIVVAWLRIVVEGEVFLCTKSCSRSDEVYVAHKER